MVIKMKVIVIKMKVIEITEDEIFDAGIWD